MINTTYKLISKLNLKNTTYGQYFEKEQIDTERLKVMYSIYEQYYENTRFSIFVDDFQNKSGAILILTLKQMDCRFLDCGGAAFLLKR